MPHALPSFAGLRRTLRSAGLVIFALGTPALAAEAPAKLPGRLITCSLGHATNFNVAEQQTLDDITYDSFHHLSLYLPPISARTTPPPDAIEKADAVDPRTRVVEDPDGITAETSGEFDRVVDLWPERVELAKTTATGLYKTILVSDYDPAKSTARMFLGTASEITTYDLKRIYMGECKVTLNPPMKRKRR